MENQTEQTQPSREEIIRWYKNEIQLASLRAELSKLQSDATVSEAERLQAVMVIAQITQQPPAEDGPQEGPKEDAKTRTLKREAPLEEVH
jgi:hypothetical protein